MADKPYLTLVDPRSATQDNDSEFLPLPYYPWDERPDSTPLDVDECATAIHIAQANLPKAASLLKVPVYKLERMLRRHPRLVHVLQETTTILGHRAAGEMIDALDSPNDRRREWASTKILATRALSSHPFAPAPPQPSTANIALTAPTARTITFRFRTDDDPDPDDPNAA